MLLTEVTEPTGSVMTVSRAFPLFVPSVAVMALVPGSMLVASPLLLMLAVAGAAEVQVTLAVRSWVLPSL